MDFQTAPIKNGLMFSNEDAFGKTEVYGVLEGDELVLPEEATHFGVVVEGEATLIEGKRTRTLYEGDYFSQYGVVSITTTGRCCVVSHHGYKAMNVYGGPIEEHGRLKYIDGCTDSLLIPPVIKGDPCFNHLHFPKHITQTPHTHPSIRAGLVYRGNGECLLGDGTIIPLTKGNVFLLAPEGVHSFNTQEETMDIIVFHPDSDFGPEHDEHPMINRTIVDGVSAKHKAEIRTEVIAE